MSIVFLKVISCFVQDAFIISVEKIYFDILYLYTVKYLRIDEGYGII